MGITSSDKSIFLKADGIGSRVAARIVSELQDKINQFSIEEKIESYTNLELNNKKGDGLFEVSKSLLDDCVSAIVNLGYTRSEAYKAVMNAQQDIKNHDEKEKISIEKVVTLALKKISG